MPDRVVISNTSPIIYLHRVGLLDLFSKLYGKILIPSGVHEEILEGTRRGAELPDIGSLPWVEVRALVSKALLPAIADLGKGEAEVIGLGKECGSALLIIDDHLGREIAKFCGLDFTGTLGVLLKARQQSHISALAPVLSALQQAGFWLDQDLIRMVLQKAGESL